MGGEPRNKLFMSTSPNPTIDHLKSLALLSLLPFLALLLAGCQNARAEEELTETPKTVVAFEGNPDPAFAGEYHSSDGRSVYTFDPNGSFDLRGKVVTNGGSFDNHVTGSWAVKDDRFLFKYGDGNVVPYAFKREGGKLRLTLTGSMKRETVLIKR